MKTTRIQFNATTFKATRDVIAAYFGATYDLAIELDKARKNTRAYREVLDRDREDLAALLLGGEEAKSIHRTREQIEESIRVNQKQYDTFMKPYNAMVETTSDAIAKAVALFDNKDSALYKAYADYVTSPTDDKYDVYAKAMADRFIELGLSDATADNVAHYMPNADRALKGTTAVKKGKIVDALTAKNFALAVLRKIYDNNATAFPSDKFVKYVKKCADKAKNNK